MRGALLVLIPMLAVGGWADRAEAARRKAASAPRPTSAPAPEPPDPRPLDVVQEEIVRKHKSKAARSLKKAWDALQAKRYAQAVQLASQTASNPLYADYAHWISASASQGAALAALGDRKYSEAIRHAGTAIAFSLRIEAETPSSPMLRNLPREIGLSEIAQGDAQAGLKRWPQAEAAFERGFQRLLSSGALGLARPASLLNYATACSKKPSGLCEAWIQRFAAYYPRNSEEIRAVIKVFPSASERPKSAFPGRTTAIYRAPDLDQVAFETALALYLDGKFGAAIKAFQQFADEFPKSAYRFRARYWHGQALTQEQEHEKALKSHETLQLESPLTYYGLLAALTVGKPIDATIDVVVPKAIERDPLLQPSEVLRVTRAEEFIAEGALELAAQELKDFRSRDPLSNPFLMYLAALNYSAHCYSTAFAIMSDLIARGHEGAASSMFLRMIFPLAHLDTIRKHAGAQGLDPTLVLSLIKQESAFDVGAISSSGALGLMQLMPATAADTERGIQRADLVQADANIRVGTRYLKQLMTRFNGNIVYSLAGYNAGPNAVDRWIRESGGKRGMLEFIDTIPYRETREYVGAIIRNYYWYSRKMSPSDPPKPLAYFWGQLDKPQPAATEAPAVPPPSPSTAPDAGEPSAANDTERT